MSGPVLIPLLRAGGVRPATAGAILLLGSSMGGELFNPGAVEVRKLAELTGLSSSEVVARSTVQILLACGMPLLSFWALSQFRGKHKPVPGALDAEAESKPAVGSVDSSINPVKAVVPVLPLVLLFTDSSLGAFSPLRALEGPAKILAAMLIGIFLAGLTSPRVGGQLATAFFEGAGYAYTHVISLIVAAATFAEGIDRSGLIAVIVQGLVGRPMAALAVSAVAPWCLQWSRAPPSRRQSRSWSSSCRPRRRCTWTQSTSAWSPRSARISDGR